MDTVDSPAAPLTLLEMRQSTWRKNFSGSGFTISLYLCLTCLKELPWTDPQYHCQQCGNRSPEPDRLRCSECMEDVWDLYESRSGFEYIGIIRDWILRLKFYGQEYLAPILGRLLALNFKKQQLAGEI